MQRALPLLLVLLATLALVPSASACSLAGPPEHPAAFLVWDTQVDAFTRVNLEHRGLGASCELTNPHALDGDVFAWGDGGRVLAVDLTTGANWTVAHQGARGLSADDGWVLLRTGDDAHPVQAVRLDGSGESRNVPVEDTRSNHVLIAGDQAFQVPRDEATFSVYDVSKASWIVLDREAHVPGSMHPAVAGDGWLLVDANGTRYAVEVATGDATERPSEGYWTLGIEEGYLYQADPDDGDWVLERAAVPAGGFTTYARNVTPQPLGPVTDGRVVLGAFSVPNGTDGGGVVTGAGLGVPAGGLAATILAGVVAAGVLGRRQMGFP